MYIRYLKNIYAIGKFYSITRHGETGISLAKQGGNYTSLEFDNAEMREYILDEIWNKLKSGEVCFDIDEAIKQFSCIKNYNMI